MRVPGTYPQKRTETAKISAEAYSSTLRAGQKLDNPYNRNSIEYRYWQDGERMAMQELEDAEERQSA